MRKLIFEDLCVDGNAYFNQTNNFFQFNATEPVTELTKKFRTSGIGQALSDGSFHFTPCQRKRSKATRLANTNHGSLSVTSDGGILLWIKVNAEEALDVDNVIMSEAEEAIGQLNASDYFKCYNSKRL